MDRIFAYKVTLIEPGAVGTDMQPQPPEEQPQLEENLEALKAEDIAACVLYTITQPKRCDVVVLRVHTVLRASDPPPSAEHMIQ